MTNDLISRDTALDVLRNAMNGFRIVGMRSGKTLLQSAVNEAWEGLNNIPAVDAAPVVHASYGFVGPHIGSLYASHGTCGNCKERILIDPRHKKFCPHCGARMDKEE